MVNTRGAVRRMDIPSATSADIIRAINTIRIMTYDPSLRSLLTDVEYERASIEERIIATERANNLYKTTVARMDLARNRRTQQELAGLAEVQHLGWTNDTRRRNVDLACSERAAHGYGACNGMAPHGPSSRPTQTQMFKDLDWKAAVSRCCTNGDCRKCCPMSPGCERYGFHRCLW